MCIIIIISIDTPSSFSVPFQFNVVSPSAHHAKEEQTFSGPEAALEPGVQDVRSRGRRPPPRLSRQ